MTIVLGVYSIGEYFLLSPFSINLFFFIVFFLFCFPLPPCLLPQYLVLCFLRLYCPLLLLTLFHLFVAPRLQTITTDYIFSFNLYMSIDHYLCWMVLFGAL